MKAVVVSKALSSNDPECLLDKMVAIPTPKSNDLLVKVEAISVNPADYRQRQQKQDDGESRILGWDVAGLIVAKGDAVPDNFQIGNKVYYAGDLNRAGANSEFHCVDYRLVGHCPPHYTASQASAIPLTALTAWEVLFDRIGLRMRGENRHKTILIIGGAGGTGSMAIQLAKLVPDLKVIATASRKESQAWCQTIGADEVINHATDIALQLVNLGLATIDVVLIFNDPDSYFPIIAEILSPQGTICCIVPFLSPPNLNLLMRKSATFIWEFMFTRSMFNTHDMYRQGEILDEISQLITEGKIKSIATQDFGVINAENLCLAHQQLESKKTIGKIILTGF